LGLVERMCAATKSRFADEILAIARLEAALTSVRNELSIAPTEHRAGCLVGSDDPGVRALACWFLAGTARYPMDGVPRRQGDLAAVWEVARELGVPADLLNLLSRAARRMPWPLAVLLPLAYASKSNGTPDQLAQATPFETWRGIPLYALDQFTRRGRVAIGRWLADCRELQETLQAAAPRPAWPKITRYAVFAVESQVCGRHLMWPEQRDVLRRSMQAELTARLLHPEAMDALVACARANLPGLNDHRRQVMDEALCDVRRYLENRRYGVVQTFAQCWPRLMQAIAQLTTSAQPVPLPHIGPMQLILLRSRRGEGRSPRRRRQSRPTWLAPKTSLSPPAGGDWRRSLMLIRPAVIRIRPSIKARFEKLAVLIGHEARVPSTIAATFARATY
jgi:hypothetical protein